MLHRKQWQIAFIVLITLGSLASMAEYATARAGHEDNEREEQQFRGGLETGGPIMLPREFAGDNQAAHDCLTAEDRQRIHQGLRAYEELYGPLSRSSDAGVTGPSLLYPFLPMAGRPYQDIMLINFVDFEPTAGSILDYACTTTYTYDGHRGIDMLIRTFEEQAIGVPIFAALDGVVTFTQDGHPDMNTQCVQGGNGVTIDHGNGRIVVYWHMRNGSVAVNVGQAVRAGQQIGLTASSGCSDYPHLHFESWQDNDVYEPYSGECRPGPSGWVDQEPLITDMWIYGFAPSRTSILPGPPFPMPRDRQVLLSDPLVRFWIILGNLPAASNWQVQFVRPNGTVAFTSAVTPFNNPANPFRRYSWWGWNYNVINVSQIPGTWHIRLFINGVLQVNAPVDAVQVIDPQLNQPPVAISPSLSPSTPDAAQAIICHVTAPLIMDDPDYQVVRYRYEWRVNGHLKREVTSAGRTDALAAGVACSGSTVECRVTPMDGSQSGATVAVTATVLGAKSPDINCDGVVGVPDLLAVIAAWGPCPAMPAMCPADMAPSPVGDGTVGVPDLLMVIANWG